jgi:hypothetical protein
MRLVPLFGGARRDRHREPGQEQYSSGVHRMRSPVEDWASASPRRARRANFRITGIHKIVTAAHCRLSEAARRRKTMARKEKLIVVRNSGDELLFASPSGLTSAQRKVVRSITRTMAIREFGEAKVREAEATGLALMPRPIFAAPQSEAPRA